jgi:type II secretory pathway pseudopilin PulG
MTAKQMGRLASSAGYTVVEALTVVGVVGAVAAFSAPSISRFKAKQEVQAATSQVGGMLQQVRARAAKEGIPYLVLFQQEEVVDGQRSAFALIVRDEDRSYTLTTPDAVETFTLDADLRPEVRQFGQESGSTAFQEMPIPEQDKSNLLERYESWAADNSGPNASGCSGPGPCLDPSDPSYVAAADPASPQYDPAAVESALEKVIDRAMNGTTFPVSEDSGVPAVAFNERGIPVSPDSPQDWGTGSGAVYLTDNRNAVHAAIVSPLGEVSLARYDPASGSWK